MILSKITDVVCYKIKLVMFKIKWRKLNVHNFTTTNSLFPIDLVKVGNYSYGPIQIYNYGEINSGLEIGNLCSIAQDVKFILGGNHYTNRLFTYPINPMISGFGCGGYSKGKIIIGHDCWIGIGTILLSGISIGNGCVIAAGSVVTKSFPPYSIIGGSPAKLLRMRFSEDIIVLLEKNQFIYNLPREKYLKCLEQIEEILLFENIQPILDIYLKD